MSTVDVLLKEDLAKKVKKVALKKRVSFKTALDMCYSVGLERSLRSRDAWNDLAKEQGLYDEIVRARAEKDEKLRRVMDHRSRSVSKKFDGYEGFNNVTTMLISYLGKRAEAVQLKSQLEKKGIKVDISPGEVPNLDVLTRRYLFKDKKNG